MKSFLLIFCFLLNTTFGQEKNFCGGVSEGVESSSIPTSGTFKSLIVLCKFQDDIFDLSPHTDLWPHNLNSMPSWGPDLISTTVQTTYTDPSMSGYFKVMSNGVFDVIGDVVFYQPQYNESYYYISNGKHIGYLVEEILTNIDPFVNYADYDNNNDGVVDMIKIAFRFASVAQLDNNSYQGIA